MNWREWEGQTLDSKFVLGGYLGGSDTSAVFRTRVGNGAVGTEEGSADAAIKLVALGGAGAESQLQLWKAASELSHPNLIRILAMGHATEEGRELVYVVEEFAEENLAQIVPERALTAEEVGGMLAPVLAGLDYLHSKGMVHGGIKPSNILAAGDLVKLSSDSLRKVGEVPRQVSPYDAPEVPAGISAASDMWSLGMTLVEVLTQRAPAWDAPRMKPPEISPAVPEPYRGIARSCLAVDPAKRCGIREIDERLKAKRTIAAVAAPPALAIAGAQRKTAKWPYLLVLPVAVAVMLYLILRPHSATGPEDVQTSSVPPPAVQPAPSRQPRTQSAEVQSTRPQTGAASGTAPSQEETTPVRSGTTGAPQPSGEPKTAAKDEIVQRVMPQVSASAQRTITGKIKVRVRVKVDAAGHVTQATLKEAGPSKYFSRLALEAAKRWKFSPAQNEDAGREWTLLFVFSRARTEVSPARVR